MRGCDIAGQYRQVMRQWTPPSRIALAVGTVTLLAAGCGQPASPGGAGSPTSSPGRSTETSASSTPSPSASGSSSSGSGPRTNGCLTRNLSLTVKQLGAAAGSAYSRVVMTNTGSSPCVTGGYGGVSFVGKHGQQLGAAADRDHSTPARRIVLEPGERAGARLQIGDAGNYPSGSCQPARAKGFRVYPPNETHAAIVAHPEQVCASAKVHQLNLQPYRKLH